MRRGKTTIGLCYPLMVLQIPNTPNPNEIGRALQTIF